MLVSYSKDRKQFGKSISNFQAISFKLADMYTEIEVKELLIYRACQLIMNQQSVTKESAMAKHYSSEACVRIANDAVQIFGGYGYTKDFPVEILQRLQALYYRRGHFRDSKISYF